MKRYWLFPNKYPSPRVPERFPGLIINGLGLLVARRLRVARLLVARLQVARLVVVLAGMPKAAA